MFEPDDFGMSAAATLAHVADPTPSRHHVPFWKSWVRAIAAEDPRLTHVTGPDPDPADASATHQFISHRHVRIGCRLMEPQGPRGQVRAGLVTLHGYDHPAPLSQEEERWSDLASRGVSVLAIRVRGYPGSLVDTGNWTSPSWVTRGLDVPFTPTGPDGLDTTNTDLMAWSMALAVADVVNACRAMVRKLGSGAPLYLRGESFGAALAVIAASLSAQHPELGFSVDRLQIGLPTLGDWKWRLADQRARRVGGTQREIVELLTREATRSEELIERLRVCDTAIHAQRVRCPVLCKLALRDEIVPAPAAAAVFNALYTAPGRKWRFVTPYGHFDGGIKNARRHALFDRCAIDFLDPVLQPVESMLRWQPLLARGERLPDSAIP